jgi:hypothetical protein
MADNQQRPYSLSSEAMALRLQSEGHLGRLQRRLKMLAGRSRAYRKTFFDEHGQLYPHAREVLMDIVQESNLHRASRDLEPLLLADLEGSRRLALHIFGRLKPSDSELDAIENDLTEMEE